MNILNNLLQQLRAFSDNSDGEHPILDHKEKYEFNKQDHHWHLKSSQIVIGRDNLAVTKDTLPLTDGEQDTVFSENLSYEIDKALKNGWNVEKAEDGSHLLLPPSDDILYQQFYDYNTGAVEGAEKKIYEHGHTIGFFKAQAGQGIGLHPNAIHEASILSGAEPYMAGASLGLHHGVKATKGGSSYLSLNETGDQITLSPEDINNIYHGTEKGKEWQERLGMNSGAHVSTGRELHDFLVDKGEVDDDTSDVKWYQAQELKDTIPDKYGVDPEVAEDWASEWVGHPPLEDSDDLENWLNYHNHYPYSADEKKEALEFMTEHQVPEHLKDEWEDANFGAATAGTAEELGYWLDQNHPDWNYDYDVCIDALSDAKGLGADEDVLRDVLDEHLNKNSSDGGLISDDNYEDRHFRMEDSKVTIREHLGVDSDSEESFSELLKKPEIQKEFMGGTLAGSQRMLDNGNSSPDWGSHSAHQLIRQNSESVTWLETASPDQKEQFFADAGRYLDKCTDPQQARLVLSDDRGDARSWLSEGEYRWRRLTEVPDGDYNVRTRRENIMGIGRVNYAALGFEAALPPKIIDGQGFDIPKSDLQSGRVADFRTQGYGDIRFAFTGVENCSHAVNDTYYDPRYCPDGGGNALIQNAVSFARHQTDERFAYSPSVNPSAYGPNFLEMHPNDISVDRLSQVQMYGYDSDSKTPFYPSDHTLIRTILSQTPASIVITPTSKLFYPDGIESAKGSIIQNGVKESKSRESIDEAQEQVIEAVKNLGFSDKDASRVSLYIPAWYAKGK